jgi:uncharacterized protein (TIGR02145 family)
MKTNRFSVAAISIALALVVFACSSDDDGNGGNTCGGKSYDVTSYRCENGELVGSCRGRDYHAEYEQCVNGEIKDIVETRVSSSSVGSSSSVEEVSNSSSIATSSSSAVPSSSSSTTTPSSNSVVSSSSSVVQSSSSSATTPSSSSSVSSGYTGIYGTLSYEGQDYKTVLIGTQVWMAENLNYNASGSKCYNNNVSNCAKYGRLYDWETAKTVCPSGWHLPTDDEWTTLTDNVGGASTAGKKLKATSGWNSGGNGTDEFGFAALPGGISSGNNFYNVGNHGSWWSATESNASFAYVQYLDHVYEYDDEVFRGSSDKSFLRSVRCIQGYVPSSSSAVPSSSSVIASSSSVVPSSSSTSIDSGTLVDNRDSKTYKWVKIGEQTWMAENLNYNASGRACYTYICTGYDDVGGSCIDYTCSIYGGLYIWATARTVCPSGWHLPSDAEWTTLTNFVGSNAGTKLKATSQTSFGGTDDYGFSALPGGDYMSYDNGSYGYTVPGRQGNWWSASEYDASNAYYRYMSNNSEGVGRTYRNKSYGLSVRCVKD